MGGCASSSSACAAASPPKRAPFPASVQSANADATSQPQPIHSPIAPSPTTKARVDLPLECDDQGRASADSAAPVERGWSDLSLAQRCFSDGLALIFSSLSLFNLASAARTCRSWRVVAIQANVAGAELHGLVKARPGGSARLQSLTSSPFRRHVHALTYDGGGFAVLSDGIFPLPEWTLLDLAMLQHLPQLRRISNVRVELACALPDLPIRFPPLLESADLHLSFDKRSLNAGHENTNIWRPQRLVLEALLPCRSLTELSLTLRPWTKLCLDGLLELSTLRLLTLNIRHARDVDNSRAAFTEEHMCVVKQLPNLRRLKLRERVDFDFGPDEDELFGTRWLRWLCPPPHRLQLQQLQELDLRQHSLHLGHMQLLQRLPSLTALEPRSICESALPLLPGFASRLQRLQLAFTLWDVADDIDPELVDLETEFARGPLLLPHLTPCAALTHLTLSKCAFAEDEATALCLALPQLRVLVLSDIGWPSLDSLQHLPQLETLTLRQSISHMPRSLLLNAAHVAPLTLQRLSLIHALAQPLTAALRDLIAALQPPSALLPTLYEFRYEA